MAIKTATVFGGSWFLGRHLIRRLAKTCAVILAAVRHPNRSGHLRPMGDVGQITALRCDVGNDRDVAAAVAGSDIVIILVGILYQFGTQRFQRIQAEGRRAASPQAAVEGWRAGDGPCLGDRRRCGFAVALCAQQGRRRARGAGRVSRRRHSPPEHHVPDRRTISSTVPLRHAGASLAPALPLIGGGTTRKFQPVYVGDVADAIMTALVQPKAKGRTFELGGPRTYSFRELMELVLRETGRRRPLVSVPWGLATLKAAFLELLPVPPLTRDQGTMLKTDNVVSPTAPTASPRSASLRPRPRPSCRPISIVSAPAAASPPRIAAALVQ